MATNETLAQHYPEVNAGGFSRVDGTVQFYSRVQTLLDKDTVVLEFGAGRGAALVEDPVATRRRLRILGGEGRTVIGVDVDPAVLLNPALDRAIVVEPDQTIPLEDESVSLIVADYVFEHVDQPELVAGELCRVLVRGGWLCARTPNALSPIGLAIQAIPNAWHARMAGSLQSDRKAQDVFPTRYRMNSLAAIRRLFPGQLFENYSYTWEGEPAYFGSVSLAWTMARLIFRLTPRPMRTNLFIFLRKR